MPQTIKVLFLFLNKSLNLCFWEKSLFFLIEPSMEGAMVFNNHFLKAFMGFILTKYFLKYLSSWSNSTYLFTVNKVTMIFLLTIGNEILYERSSVRHLKSSVELIGVQVEFWFRNLNWNWIICERLFIWGSLKNNTSTSN